MLQVRARFVLPIVSPPMRDAWVAIDGDRVAGVGTGRGPAAEERDLGSVAILPGLINAHTHLELSYLREAIPASGDFVSWIRGVMSARRRRPDAGSSEIRDALARGISEAVAAGTAAVGDISNTLVPFGPLAASPLSGVLFYELLRFNPPDAAAVVRAALAELAGLPPRGGVRVSLAAHAPYSVAPEVLREIRKAMDADRRLAPCSIHLSESRAEVEFIAAGTGPWRQLLADVGSWNPAWRPAAASPVEYVDAHGLLDPRVIVVHGVQMTARDLARVAARGATLVTCPRSNRHTGAGSPPIAAFYEAGVAVAVGTDSLASTADLNVFAELAAMRALAPGVPAPALLDSATRQGARALGLGDALGAIAPGYRSRLIAVSVPPSVDDVEEYLVSGISPDQIAWVG